MDTSSYRVLGRARIVVPGSRLKQESQPIRTSWDCFPVVAFGAVDYDFGHGFLLLAHYTAVVKCTFVFVLLPAVVSALSLSVLLGRPNLATWM